MSKLSLQVVANRRRSPAERAQWVRRFHASGQTQAAFCRKHRLHPATFNAWLRPAVPPVAVFQEIEVERPVGGLELHLAGGAVLRIPEPTWLVSVLRALREAGPC